MPPNRPRRPGAGPGGGGGGGNYRQQQQGNPNTTNDRTTPRDAAAGPPPPNGSQQNKKKKNGKKMNNQNRGGTGSGTYGGGDRPHNNFSNAAQSQQQRAHARRPQDRTRPPARAIGSRSGNRPASSATVFAIREFMLSGSGSSVPLEQQQHAEETLGPAPLLSLPRLLEQMRILCEDSRNSSSSSSSSNGNMDAAVLIMSDLWEEASSMRQELELVRQQQQRAVAEAEDEDEEENGTARTFVTASEEVAGKAALEVDENANGAIAASSRMATNGTSPRSVQEQAAHTDMDVVVATSTTTGAIMGRDDEAEQQDGDGRALLQLLSDPNVARYLTDESSTSHVADYVAFLQSEDISSRSNLAEALADEEYLLTVLASEGPVTMTNQYQGQAIAYWFRDAILAAMTATTTTTTTAPPVMQQQQQPPPKRNKKKCKFGRRCRDPARCRFAHPELEEVTTNADGRSVPMTNQEGAAVQPTAPVQPTTSMAPVGLPATTSTSADSPTRDVSGGPWTCAACTFVNQDVTRLSCTICDTLRPSIEQDAAATAAVEAALAEARRLEEEAEARRLREQEEEAARRLAREQAQRAEEEARRVAEEERKRAEREKAAAAEARREKKRREAEAKRAAELEAERRAKIEEQERRQKALAEKRAALLEYSQQAASTPKSASSTRSSSKSTGVGTPRDAAKTEQPPSPSSTLVAKPKVSTPTAIAATPSRSSSVFATPSRSSSARAAPSAGPLILYPSVRENGPTDSPSISRGPISPLFKMLRDPSSIPKVRIILPLETTIAKLKLESGGIQLDIASCHRQKQKIEDEYLEGKGKTKEERRKEAEKKEKGALKALDDRYQKAFRKLRTETDVAMQKKNPDSVKQDVKKKKDALHAKHLAKFEAMEQGLREKRARLDRERDEKLGVFRLESIQKKRVEALGALDEKHDDAITKLDEQKKKSLDNLDRELSAVKEKLEKKKNAALSNIDRQEGDKLDNVRANDKIPKIQRKRLQRLEEAGITDNRLRIRMMMSAEQIQIEDEIAEELAVAQKEYDAKVESIKANATSKRSPVIKEYETNFDSLTNDIAERRRVIEEEWSNRRPKMIEEYEAKRQEMVEEFESQKFAVEEEKKLCSKSVMDQYNEDIKLFEAERLKTTTEIRAQRRLIQPLVDKEMASIEQEALRDIAEVEKHQKEVVKSFNVKNNKLKEDLDKAKEEIKKETSDRLLKLEMDEEKRLQVKNQSIDEQNNKIEELEMAMGLKQSELESVRQELVESKGQKEDPSFNVSTSRDAFGNTFLIVAAQTNDLPTANLLLALGAAPNETNDDGLTAMVFASYFQNQSMISLLSQNKASPSKLPFDAFLGSRTQGLDQFSVDWETQLRVSEQSAIPPDTFLASAEDLDKDEDSKMPTLAIEDQRKDYSCFEGRLLNPDATTNFQRTILIEKSAHSWFVDPERSSVERSQFLALLRSLLPGERVKAVCHRRAVVGVQPQFEVLCSALDPNKTLRPAGTVVHFTPFVSSQNRRGIADVGVLVWAVSSESRASYLKALIEQSEWKRNKVDDANERFLPHTDHVLPLGKNMHLLDLKATSAWKTGPMTLMQVSVDSGELERLLDPNFTPKTRSLESEKILREQLFRRTQSEEEENEQILDGTSDTMSTNLFGGAGTGKTMLLMQKVASDSAPHKKMLVVARLPRLVGFIKAGVKAQKGLNVNVDYFTYDELLTSLARRCCPANASDDRTFSVFNQIHFSETTGTGGDAGLSFQSAFVDEYLNPTERSVMSKGGLEPLTIWTAIRVIKSHTSVSRNLRPLSRDEYASLPKSFGLDPSQRSMAYDFYEKYCDFMQGTDRFLWDEADRVLYCLKYGGSVFSDAEYVSWEERAFKWGEAGLADEDGLPVAPFVHNVFVDEAQDYSDLDIALFIRLSSGTRSIFLGADPAQSVESGIRMREGGVNDVFNICTPSHVQVKTVLQDIRLIHNHRTHQQNLDLSKAVRRILSRSFCVPFSEENSIAKGPLPEALLVKKLSDLGDHAIFKGVNTVFIVPDEKIIEIRSLFFKLGIKNDVFGVREAKGLEFEACAVLGFFNYFEKQGNSKEWQNVIRWLFSTKGIKDTESSEVVNSARLEPCDYLLSHPEIEDQAMMLYTALTRARTHLYIIEDEESGKALRRGKGSVGLGDFAFRLLQQLHLVKKVRSIDAGENEMTPQEHNARGVLLVTKAIALSNEGAKTEDVVQVFQEAADRFRPDKGNDPSLLHQCEKHLRAILTKRSLIQELKTSFWSQKRGAFLFGGRFSQILAFETKAADFVSAYIDDPFVLDEARQLSVVMEDAFYGSPYWSHFEPICAKIKSACT